MGKPYLGAPLAPANRLEAPAIATIDTMVATVEETSWLPLHKTSFIQQRNFSETLATVWKQLSKLH